MVPTLRPSHLPLAVPGTARRHPSRAPPVTSLTGSGTRPPAIRAFAVRQDVAEAGAEQEQRILRGSDTGLGSGLLPLPQIHVGYADLGNRTDKHTQT
jgi:hypothetical protein